MDKQQDSVSRFSAVAALTGYLYQCRYALFESLRRLRGNEDFVLSIETLDDVVFESDGSAPELLQTKHHIGRVADLTDASPDLWKAIRVWSVGWADRSIPAGSRFLLVTTAAAAEGSAAHYLKPGSARDAAKAVERLNTTANSSTSLANAPAYLAFRSLGEPHKQALAEAVSVLDGMPPMKDLGASLRQEVYFAAPREHLDSFLWRIEGWWLDRAVQHLTRSRPTPILSEELDAEIAQLREQFKQDNLPIDEDIMAASVNASGYRDRAFVHQLRLIEVGNPRIFHAIRNYFRASEQRSRWIREDLVLVGELDRYEDRLFEEWDILFQQMRDELGDAAAEEHKKQKAQVLYTWIETGRHRPIRKGVTEPAIARGTYQILADRQKVGWHLDFVERLRRILQTQEM